MNKLTIFAVAAAASIVANAAFTVEQAKQAVEAKDFVALYQKSNYNAKVVADAVKDITSKEDFKALGDALQAPGAVDYLNLAATWYRKAKADDELKALRAKQLEAGLERISILGTKSFGIMFYRGIDDSIDIRETALAIADKANQILASEPVESNKYNVADLYSYTYNCNKLFGSKLPTFSAGMIAYAGAKAAFVPTKDASFWTAWLQSATVNKNNLTAANWTHRAFNGRFDNDMLEKLPTKEKILFAASIGKADVVLDCLADVKQNMFDANELQKILTVLNGQKADWRASEVLVALKNINSMYTTKLYDDRDAWEPVLSKLRAMIEIR